MEPQVNQDVSAQYQRLDNYDWDNDGEFQGGLRAILNSASPDQASRLILRARCYYFARKFGTPVDFEGYLHWTTTQNGAPNGVVHGSDSTNQPHTSIPQETSVLSDQPNLSTPQESQQTSTPAPSPMGTAPPPASFAEICTLIAEGKPIPGIKDIPDTVLEGQATQSQVPRRKKPWEKDADPAPVPSWARAS